VPENRVFNKPVLSVAKQIELLKSRGLAVNDSSLAAHYLQYIGYYRFSGYLYPFRQADENYADGTSFEQVLDLYIFDRKLRLLTFDAIERIEVALRSCMTSVVGEAYGAHWFADSTLFENQGQFEAVTTSIRRETKDKPPQKRDIFIRHYYDHYDSPEFPPSWMVFETLSMGTVSLAYKFLNLDLRKQIAQYFAVDEKILVSWIHALVYTRNLCAHHSRLWNRVFTIKPIAMKRYKQMMTPTEKFSAQAAATEILLNTIAPNHHWQKHLNELLDDHAIVDKKHMGFSSDWNGFVWYNIITRT
jgi:abortive infection bacteriophage resistance protein